MVPRPKPGGDSLLYPNLNEDLVALTNPKRCHYGSKWYITIFNLVTRKFRFCHWILTWQFVIGLRFFASNMGILVILGVYLSFLGFLVYISYFGGLGGGGLILDFLWFQGILVILKVFVDILDHIRGFRCI